MHHIRKQIYHGPVHNEYLIVYTQIE